MLYFTYSIYTEQESENTAATASPEARDYLKLLSYIYMMAILLYLQKTRSTDPTVKKDNFVDELLPLLQKR